MPDLFPNNPDALRLLDGVRDPNRMEIILLLGRGKPLNVGEISSQFKISRPAISHHLKVLKDAGIVTSEKIGQEVFYCLDRARIVAGLRQIADAIENCCDSASNI
ncbi:MAG TPA: metalloregulator ArsR/SmtB family transcription factor [Anaerolineaceae bacterium]|jgi:DNA-binding transcriptional ArsR family regulator